MKPWLLPQRTGPGSHKVEREHFRRMNVARLLVGFGALLLSQRTAHGDTPATIQGIRAAAVEHQTVTFGDQQISPDSASAFCASGLSNGLASMSTPATVSSFAGFIRDSSVGSIPDTMGAVGPNHLMIAINGRMIIQTRQGVLVQS